MRSEFQARCEVETVSFDGVLHIEVVDPAGVKVEMTLTQLCGVGNNGANAERTPDKPVEPVS